jgi:hypothetical protein
MSSAQRSVETASTRGADPDYSVSADQILKQHHDLLQAHRKFLVDLKTHVSGSNGITEVLAVCSSQMDALEEEFEQCRSQFARRPRTFNPPTVEDEGQTQPVPPASNASNLEPLAQSGAGINGEGKVPVVDESGFFMTDIKPTPVEELLRASKQRTAAIPSRSKRKFSGEEPSSVHHHHAVEGRTNKKARLYGKSSGNLSRPGGEDRTLDNHEQSTQQDAHDEAFIRSVQDRLAIEEQQKRRKANRKRKRESGGSDAPSIQDAEQQNGGRVSRRDRKKAKTTSSATTSETASNATTTPLKQSRQQTPQPDRSQKRSSPATDYISTILSNAEKARVKRQKV